MSQSMEWNDDFYKESKDKETARRIYQSHFKTILQHAQINHFPFKNMSAAATLSNLLYFHSDDIGPILIELDDMNGFDNSIISSLENLSNIEDLTIRLNYLLFLSTNKNIKNFSKRINAEAIIHAMAKAWPNLGKFNGLYSKCIRLIHCMNKLTLEKLDKKEDHWVDIYLETIKIKDPKDPYLNSDTFSLVTMMDEKQLERPSQPSLAQIYSSLMVKYWKLNFDNHSEASQLALIYCSFALNTFIRVNDALRRSMRKLLFPKDLSRDLKIQQNEYIEKVLSCPDSNVTNIHGEFLYNLFSQNPARLTKAIGLGLAAGTLYRFGHLQDIAQKISDAQIVAKSHEDLEHCDQKEYMSSDLEDFAELNDKDFKELLGRTFHRRVGKEKEEDNDTSEEMTLEEKEVEAERLMKLMDKMDRGGIIKIVKREEHE